MLSRGERPVAAATYGLAEFVDHTAFIRHLESYHQQRMTTVFSVQTRYLEGTGIGINQPAVRAPPTD
jgi:hypothetical protein